MGTPLYSTPDLEMPAPERSDGMKRVNVAPENPSPHNGNTRHRACEEANG